MFYNKTSTILFYIGCSTGMTLTTAHAEENWKFSLKNAYIDRNFEQQYVNDTGSWSQAASLFYTSSLYDTPVVLADQPLKVGVDASVQYAVRLSADKHVDDSVIPFDKDSKKQASDFIKKGATLKVKYQKAELRLGELWLNLPMTSTDTSRLLLNSYSGVNVNVPINNQFKFEAGHINKYSGRNNEDFESFSYTQNGKKEYSDGLNYINLNYNPTSNLNIQYYFGQLTNLYDKHYLGLTHTYKTDDYILSSKFKYFNSQDNSQLLNIDSQNVSFLGSINIKNHSFGLGYQKIIGDMYPLPDGFLPETYFINWNVTGFFKENERSIHAIYGYDFKDYVSGLKTMVKFSKGNDIKTSTGVINSESELDILTSYQVQNKSFEGLSFQHLIAKYEQKHGNDFLENRFFINYQIKF